MSLKMSKRMSLALSVSALIGMPQISAAQSAIDALRDEVVVTATKKADAENIQDVPLSVTAFNEDSLEALKVRDLQSLTFSAPNVSLDDIGTARGTANFAIRGLGVNSSIPSIDPTVGVFVDGVYLGLNSGVVFDLFDLDSIEVLRGPQGLLFGRNTTGGAILINTGNPTDEFEYKARLAVEGPVDSGRGGINTFAQGVISGPIVEDVLKAKLGIYYNNDDGYFENQFDGSNHGAAETYILRGALEWTPADELSILAKVDFFDSEGDGPSAQNRGVFERDTFDFSIDNPGLYEANAVTTSVKVDWDVGFGDGTITNIFGYRDYDTITDGDIDALAAFLFHSSTELEQRQISNELRYSGTLGNAELTAGIYYFDQDVDYTEVRDLPPLSPLTFFGGGGQDHSVFGAFYQVDYNVTDQLIFTAGLRYSTEDKDANITFIRPRPACSFVDSSCPSTGLNPFIPTEPNGVVDSDSWSNFTPKFGLQYFFNDDMQVFANYTKGFRSGGYNFRITNPALFADQVATTGSPSFDEEEVDAFEIGGKFQTPDGRGQINLSVFHTEISDMQREVNISSPTAGVSQFILNTADATIQGIEAEGRYAVTDNLLLTGMIGLIDASYDEVLFDISGDGVVNAIDEALELPRVPEATYGVGLIHEIDFDAGGLVTRVNFQHRDRIAYTDNNFGFVQAADILDGNITWNTPVDGVALSLYGKNLLDEVQVGGDTQLPFGGPRGNGVNVPFDDNPAAGTFSPLKKGRVVGLELTIRG